MPQSPTNTTTFDNNSFCIIGQNILSSNDIEKAKIETVELINLFKSNFDQIKFRMTLSSANYVSIAFILNQLFQKKLLPANACNDFLTVLVNDFQEKLQNSTRITSDIANFIYHLGQASKSTGKIQADFTPLIRIFTSSIESIEAPSRDITYFINGLVYLRKNGANVQSNFTPLIERFTNLVELSATIQSPVTTTMIYGLGLICQMNGDTQTNFEDLITAFISRIEQNIDTSTAIANLIYGLGSLNKKQGHLEDRLSPMIDTFGKNINRCQRAKISISYLSTGIELLCHKQHITLSTYNQCKEKLKVIIDGIQQETSNGQEIKNKVHSSQTQKLNPDTTESAKKLDAAPRRARSHSP